MASRPLASTTRVLVVHNAYQQRGGEDSVVDAEVDLLRQRGHEVELYGRHNDEVRDMGRLALARDTFWSSRTTRDLTAVMGRFRPDIVHVHNTMPLVSPSVYWAARAMGLPTVQTLHNFRLMCPQGMLLRDGAVCEQCVGRAPWPSVIHRCYRDSTSGSAILAGALVAHRVVGTYRSKVSLFIALNEFCRRKFIQGGLPEERLRIKPNFVDLAEGPGNGARQDGLFVGRLSPEKGVDVLARALQLYPQAQVRVAGTGELEPTLREHLAPERVLGFRSLPQVLDLMRTSRYLVLPSIWYENFPRTIVEAYACGLPVIASRLGSLPEIVQDGRTGLLFDAGSAEDLARVLRWADAHPDEMAAMGAYARQLYEAEYTPRKNYDMLSSIYSEALEMNGRER